MLPIRCVLLACLLAACTQAPRPAAPPGPDTITLLDHGWHTDIGIPAAELTGPLATFRDVFPGARSVVFSFGKRTFLMAPTDDWLEYLLGPLPGPAAIMVTGLSVPPEQAYGTDPSLVLHLPEGGAARLSDFIWQDLARDKTGHPRLIGPGPFEGSLFYAVASGYSLLHTCNTWSTQALAAAGLDISALGVFFAYQVMERAREAPLCPVPPA